MDLALADQAVHQVVADLAVDQVDRAVTDLRMATDPYVVLPAIAVVVEEVGAVT